MKSNLRSALSYASLLLALGVFVTAGCSGPAPTAEQVTKGEENWKKTPAPEAGAGNPNGQKAPH